jgi:hypothetical protein
MKRVGAVAAIGVSLLIVLAYAVVKVAAPQARGDEASLDASQAPEACLPPAPANPPGTWRVIAAAPISGRADHTAVWTGSEMLIWGGDTASGGAAEVEPTNDGAAYDPSTDTWRALAPSPLSPRTLHSASWTGSEMVVWSGTDRDGTALVDGAAYDPASDSWRQIGDAPAVAGRGNQRATLGDGGIVVAEIGDAFRLMRYDIASDAWEVLPSPPIPTRGLVSLAWADGRLILLSFPDTGRKTGAKAALYDPTGGEWRQASGSPQSTGAPAAALWTAPRSCRSRDRSAARDHSPAARHWIAGRGLAPA